VPRLLDLFCGAGGAAMGYHRAGFDEIVGVDIKPQKRFPFSFVEADALEYAAAHGREFDAIHASPPCQAYSVMKSLPNCTTKHPELIADCREILQASQRLYVIDNVPGAPLLNPFVLCGSLFGLRSHRGYLRRHRLFESNIFLLVPDCRHRGIAIGVYGHGSADHLGQRMRTANVDEARVLMGMDWATRDGMSQAIPPTYTEFIGRQLLVAIAYRTERARVSA